MSVTQALRGHWPEYLIEAWGLGTFMISAAAFTTLFESSSSPVRQAIDDADLRRALIGVAMGLTAISIVYSRWGQRSGAHINPAVTLTFLRLGKVARWDGLFFMLAQFLGGTLGVLVAVWLFGSQFTAPPVGYAATVPGPAGPWTALIAEFLISMGLMLVVLTVSNSRNYARLTGLCAGCVVALYITFEAPLSGMSMNPARTFASAAAGGSWAHAWIYYTAPVLGMQAAVEIYLRFRSARTIKCAKLDHPDHVRCIHCGYEPAARGDRQTGLATTS
ncbi:MAG: MIP/aquaporin family protein [Chromatiales bacterium]